MKTEFMSEHERDSIFGKIVFGSPTISASAMLEIQNYIISLEDRIKHLEWLSTKKSEVISLQDAFINKDA